ncbi:MAG: RraA family protein [Acetobacteraceae bacterium]
MDFDELKTVLYTAVLSDVLDGMGYMSQAMKSFIRPLDPATVIMGRARTGLYMEVYSVTADENPYELEIALLDDLKAGDVAVLACGGPTERIAPWGELLSTAARCRGAAGCVTDGLVRDVRKIQSMEFAVFHGGIGPLDSRGRGKMMTMDQPVECAGVRVCAGDIVFGDLDGVIVLPQSVAEEVILLARAKVRSENHSRDELLKGSLLGDVYRKYGVL